MASITLNDNSPTGLLKSLPGWDAIARKDQIVVEKATKAFGEALLDAGRSRLAMGEQLTIIQEKFQGTRLFNNYLQLYHLKKSTAYNYIKGYANAKQWLPDNVLEGAIARNMPIMGVSDEAPLGVYTKPVKRLPPPETNDPKVIEQYLEVLEQAKTKDQTRAAKMKEVEEDRETLSMKAFRAVSGFIGKLPVSGNSRKDKTQQISFVEDLTGMLFADLGVSSARTVEPQAVPDGFRAQVGRPRKEEVAA